MCVYVCVFLLFHVKRRVCLLVVVRSGGYSRASLECTNRRRRRRRWRRKRRHAWDKVEMPDYKERIMEGLVNKVK